MHLVNCKKPRLILNKYTHEHMYVPCGMCSYCRMKYSLRWKQRLEQEFKDNTHAVFFTLTYSEKNVPLAYLNGTEMYSDDWEETIDVSSILNLHDENTDYLYSRESFPFASKRDIQLFIKRVRKECYKYDTEIRYYVISEYGPKTYRAHFHGILFYDGERVTDKIREIVSSKWKLGFSDVKFAEQNASKYVSQYVSGSTGLPLLYNFKAFKPFVLASRNKPIGFKYFSEDNEKDLFFSSATTYIRQDKQGEHEEPLPFYYRSKLFPKCVGYDQSSRSIHRVLYGLGFCETIRRGKLETEFLNLDEVRVKVTSTDNEVWSRDMTTGGYKVLIALANRVAKFCDEQNISLETYLDCVEQYHNKLKQQLLKEQLEFQDNFARSDSKDMSSLVHLFPASLGQCLDKKREVNLLSDYQYMYNLLANHGFEFISLDPDAFDFTQTSDFAHLVYCGDKFIEDCYKVKAHNDSKDYKYNKDNTGYTQFYFGSS